MLRFLWDATDDGLDITKFSPAHRHILPLSRQILSLMYLKGDKSTKTILARLDLKPIR